MPVTFKGPTVGSPARRPALALLLLPVLLLPGCAWLSSPQRSRLADSQVGGNAAAAGIRCAPARHAPSSNAPQFVIEDPPDGDFSEGDFHAHDIPDTKSTMDAAQSDPVEQMLDTVREMAHSAPPEGETAPVDRKTTPLDRADASCTRSTRLAEVAGTDGPTLAAQEVDPEDYPATDDETFQLTEVPFDPHDPFAEDHEAKHSSSTQVSATQARTGRQVVSLPEGNGANLRRTTAEDYRNLNQEFQLPKRPAPRGIGPMGRFDGRFKTGSRSAPTVATDVPATDDPWSQKFRLSGLPAKD